MTYGQAIYWFASLYRHKKRHFGQCDFRNFTSIGDLDQLEVTRAAKQILYQSDSSFIRHFFMKRTSESRFIGMRIIRIPALFKVQSPLYLKFGKFKSVLLDFGFSNEAGGIYLYNMYFLFASDLTHASLNLTLSQSLPLYAFSES